MIERYFPWVDHLRLLAKAPPQIRYIPRALVYNSLILFQQPFHWLELLFWHRKIKKQTISHPPIFVLGYWRSGTTYLQRLLCQNPKLAYLEQYESLLPLGAIIHKRLFGPILNSIFKTFKVKHPSHGVPLTTHFPSEEDIALCSAAYPFTPMQSHIYSARAEYFLDQYLILKKDSKAFNRFVRMIRYFIQRLTYTNQGKQLVLKSPCNTTKIPELLAAFPNAKFVYISRNPKEVYFSNMKLFNNNSIQWLQEMPKEEMQTLFLSTYPKVINHYKQTKHLIPKDNLVELEFETLCKQPTLTLRKIYEQLELPNYQATSSLVEVFLEKHHEKQRYYYNEKLPPSIKNLFEQY
ncbi:MAG: sulfotransferase [Aureispira sp.]|nr:sulfotransferase [Aureispira sp.]